MVAIGEMTDVSASYELTDGTSIVAADVTWTVDNPSIATVTPGADGHATVQGISAGTAMLTAAGEGVTSTVTVTVTSAVLRSIAITPAMPSVAAGTSVQLTATGTFSDATTADLSAMVTWSSSAPAIATVSATGLLKGLTVGNTTITATFGAVSGTTSATVTAATLTAIQVTPTNPSLALGTKQQFTATGMFSDATTQNLTAQVTWASSSAATATISNAAGSQGQATALKVGTTTISATLGGVTGSTTLTVTAAVLVSIQVAPTNPSVAAGRTQQFTATGTFSDATTQNLTTQVTWTSSATTIATISNAAGSQGLATTLTPGTTTISATLAGVTGSTTLTVTAAVLVSIQVTPANLSLAVGFTQQYTATGVFSDATTQNLTTQVTWASANETIAKISTAAGTQGLATALGVGSTTISATLGAISGSTAVTVTAAVLVSIAVTPAGTTVAKGQTQQFTATGTFSDLTTQDLTRQVTWSSTNTAVAQISNAGPTQGLATAIAAGSTTISATFTGVTGSTTLTVL